MIDVLSTMQILLRNASYTTRLASIGQSSILCFEDDVITGFGCVFEDPASLLAQWKVMETSLLAHFAQSFRAAGEKAWNVYSIFLCSAPADRTQSRQVGWIEEDLERTRKVASCGIASREELLQVLLPLLPLQYQPILRPEDVTERLQARILTIAPAAAGVVLTDVSSAEVVRLLGEP